MPDQPSIHSHNCHLALLTAANDDDVHGRYILMSLRQFAAAAVVTATFGFAVSPAHAVTEIQWWHAMTGGNNDIVNRLA